MVERRGEVASIVGEFFKDYLTQMSIIDNAVITVVVVAIALLPVWLASKVIALVYGQIAKRKLRAPANLDGQPLEARGDQHVAGRDCT